VVNPAFQVLLSVQVVLVLEWVVLLISTSKSAQPVTNEYLRNSADGDGIPNNKDNNTAINKIQAGAGKTITSPTNTRILLGAMGKDSSRLTLAQMQQYITDNNLPNKSSDTSTIGDIYDYVVEVLSATGVNYYR
jgi:hypothetical protein